MDKCSDDSTLIADTPDQQVQRPTMLGGLSWQQLIVQCFEETTETNYVMSDM